MSGYRARMRCSRSLSTRRSWAARATSSATSFGWLECAIAGAPASDTGAGFLAPKGSASKGVMGTGMVPSARKVDQTVGGRLRWTDGARARPVAASGHVRYRRAVEFTAHQDQMALQRLRDQGGFSGDRIADCALATVYASGSDWLKVVVEKTDLSQSNLAGTRIREATFANTSLRKARLRGARLERVELYFCDLNEVDASEVAARRAKVHGSEAMNAVFSGAQLAVTRFEDTKLYRARFDQALLVRVVFLDSRLGGASLEKADFGGARLVDVSLRSANLQGATFAGATLVGVDFTDAALDGADFRGAVAIGCRFPAGFSP